MGGALGYIIGTVVLVPLILYIISIIFYSPNKVTDNQINQYITNSINLQDNVGDPPTFKEIDDSKNRIGHHTKTITFFLSRHGEGDRWYYTYVYLSKKYKKYFRLTVIVEGGGIIIGISYKDIILTVNQEDLNNPKYGTLDNPVPVLKFIGADKSIRDNDLDYNKAYMDKMFHDNVEMYLKYIMPKKEFKERFKK